MYSFLPNFVGIKSNIHMQNVVMVNPNKLVISSVHNELYGTEENIESSLLFQTIQTKGILTPLIVDPNNFVVSGVLRLRIALILKMDNVPVLYSSVPLEDYQVAMLNMGRRKIPSMILREFQLLKPMFQLGQGARTDLNQSQPKLEHKEALGVSKETVQKLQRIDKLSKSLYGSTDTKGYQKVWEKLDEGTTNISKMEKILKQKCDTRNRENSRIQGNFEKPGFRIINQNSKVLVEVADKSIQTIITSCPYYDKRDYEIGKFQLGHEITPEEFVVNLTDHFEECKRVLKDKGSLFVNIGDFIINRRYRLIPTQFALEMEKRGWILNDHIIWAKNNPTPTCGKRSICCTEHIFHFVLTTHFDYDLSWINELADTRTEIKEGGLFWGVESEHSKPRSFMDFRGHNIINSNASNTTWLKNECQKQGIPFTHSATFPEIIPEILIRTTSKVGDEIMDIFSGTGTVGSTSNVLGRNYIGYELNPDYIKQSIVRYECSESTKNHLLKAA
jgi:site-specific DNA-methyltransferase (adenine-specific)